MVADKLAPIALCFAFALAVTLSLSAIPRRSGDAHQYVAMALQLAQLRPPSLSLKKNLPTELGPSSNRRNPGSRTAPVPSISRH